MIDGILLTQLEWMQALAAHRQEGLTWFFYFFTAIGDVTGYLAMLPALLWAAPRFGLRVATFMMANAYFNSTLKDWVTEPRPFMLGALEPLDQVDTHSFPSGHAQMSFVFWVLLALRLRRLRWMPWLAAFVILATGLSRVYLGVHFPTDVLAGWLIGLGVVRGGLWLERRIGERVARMDPRAILASLAAAVAILAVIHLARDTAKSLAVLFTTNAVAILLWRDRGFPQDWATSALRLALGFLGLVGILLAFQGSAPDVGPQAGVLPSAIKYSLLGTWIALVPFLIETLNCRRRGGVLK